MKSSAGRLAFVAVSALLAFGATGCGVLANLPSLATDAKLDLTPPGITYLGADLVQAPSRKQLASYYCPDVVTLPFNAAPTVCQGFFGARPSPTALTIGFNLRFKISNPNRVPLPLASVLAATTVFPAATNQSLGAVCVQLCAEGQPGCAGGNTPSACQASSRDIKSLSDFGNAVTNLLIADGVAAALGQPPSFVAPRVSAAAEMEVGVRFSFGPQPLAGILRELALQSKDQLAHGTLPTFSVPFNVEGTIWFDAGSLGRIAVGYGPVSGTWVLPTDGLVPR